MAATQSWTFVDGAWHEGNPLLIGPRTHAMWLGSVVFDGGRWFEGVGPDLDLHSARVNHSAERLGLRPTMASEEIAALSREGVKRFSPDAELYIRPMYWAEEGGFMSVPPLPESTRFCLCIYETPMPPPDAGMRITVSPFRRPTLETMPTDAKAACLYPNNGRAVREAHGRGFDNALVLDMLGNVAELATANVFMVRDGVVMTPAPNGCFLNGITRQRMAGLLREDGFEVRETRLTVADFLSADEIFSTGNYSKVVPITAIEDRSLQPGPVAVRARALYWDFAHA
ncbi:MAG: branched-chain amino acid aminotransferase [Hyphomicrobiaceae bacterium]|nr:branched-chain amino acid aminotransferase [Hyphomicrobiaceae bacterium]